MKRARPRIVGIALVACVFCAWVGCTDPADEEPCVVAPGECPNACTSGKELEGAACDGPDDCACGFFCKARTGVCTYYERDVRGCLCEGEPMMAPGMPVLGLGSHVIDDLQVHIVADASDGLATPRDLAFNPESPDQLWVINFATESVTVLHNADTDSPRSQNFHEDAGGSAHFLSHPSAFAFGAPYEMASIHETHEHTPLTADDTPDEFMGPVLHDANLAIFKAGWSCHLDMIHNSPLGMGIAWDHERVYWVFDGYHASIARYDFGEDHDHGGEDHSDGDTRQYVEGAVRRMAGVPSHMVLDHDTGLLYIADTGNARLAVLDTATGTIGGNIFPEFDMATVRRVNGAEIETLPTETIDLEQPSGIELYEGHLWVTDNATSRIYALTLDGDVVDWLDTGLPAGSLMGITFDALGRLHIVDAVGNQVLRISAP